jgi:hypothetical protein
MKYLTFAIASLILALFTLTLLVFQCHADRNTPKRGEWLCWATSKSTQDCGTYGWHRQKKVAIQAAVPLCERECSSECFVDYCEQLK